MRLDCRWERSVEEAEGNGNVGASTRLRRLYEWVSDWATPGRGSESEDGETDKKPTFLADFGNTPDEVLEQEGEESSGVVSSRTLSTAMASHWVRADEAPPVLFICLRCILIKLSRSPCVRPRLVRNACANYTHTFCKQVINLQLHQTNHSVRK